jgi:hypothetical protein
VVLTSDDHTLFSGASPLLAAPDMRASGEHTVGGVWTATSSPSTAGIAGGTCADWSDDSSDFSAIIGDSARSFAWWSAGDPEPTRTCGTGGLDLYAVYCLQK